MISNLEHLKLLFERLRTADLKLKVVKCNYLKRHIQYLGHIVSGEGKTPLPEKLNRPLNALMRKDVEFEWTPMCQESFKLLKTSLMTHPILTYPDPNLPYLLFTDASKYAWACVLTQEKTHMLEGKEIKLLHPITYMSGLFRGSQLNWACFTKEAYAIYMSIKKLTYYLEDADVNLRSDHLPLKKFLAKNTLNSKVNNWAIKISPFRITFEYMKGIKNTLADTMSRLIEIDPQVQQEPELEGYEFGYYTFDDLPNIEVTDIESTFNSITDIKTKDTSGNNFQGFPISNDVLQKLQQEDVFCKNIINQIEEGNITDGQLYLVKDNILKKYVIEGNNTYKTTVVPRALTGQILRMAHDELEHKGTHRTYGILKRLYYWKQLKPSIEKYKKK